MFGDEFEVLAFYMGSALHTLKYTCDLLWVHASSLRVTQPDCESSSVSQTLWKDPLKTSFL
jgi:hypothetical protein